MPIPSSWYGGRNWLLAVLTIPFIVLAAFTTYRSRSVALGVMTTVSIFFPVIIIFVGMMIWGV